MESWKHCAKTWYSIDISLAMKNIKSGSIVKCKINEAEYLFNTSNGNNLNIIPDMIKNGEWHVYTWSD